MGVQCKQFKTAGVEIKFGTRSRTLDDVTKIVENSKLAFQNAKELNSSKREKIITLHQGWKYVSNITRGGYNADSSMMSH